MTDVDVDGTNALLDRTALLPSIASDASIPRKPAPIHIEATLQAIIEKSSKNAARRTRIPVVLGGLAVALSACGDLTNGEQGGLRPLDPILVAQGQEIFRHDTYGDEVYWTDPAHA